MITISLCMIVKNEEEVLYRCLNSVKDAVDEIIIVDTGSNDRTKEIAKEFTDKIYDFKWCDDFSKARNFSFSKATMDYQMWLDADDILLENDRKKLIELKKTLDNSIDVVTMKYNYHFDEFDNPTLTMSRERLLKTEKNFTWNDPVHEYIQITGKIYKSDICISHKKKFTESDRNLKIYESMIKNNIPLSTRSLYYYGRELKDHKRYIESIYYFEKFLKTEDGWVEDKISSCFELANCYKNIGDSKKRLRTLFKSFLFDTPRAEICTEIGYYFKDVQNYNNAIFWFDVATKLIKPASIGFILNDYWGYLPNIELCICYYRIGNIAKAKYHNEIAGSFNPNSPSVIKNREFFQSL